MMMSVGVGGELGKGDSLKVRMEHSERMCWSGSQRQCSLALQCFCLVTVIYQGF